MALQLLCIQEQLRDWNTMYLFADSMAELCIHGIAGLCRTFALVPTSKIR